MNIEIINEYDNQNIYIDKQTEKDGVFYIQINVVQKNEEIPKKFRLKWRIPAIDCYSVWSPQMNNRGLGPNWSKKRTNSRLATWMPLHSVLSGCGKNRMTIAVSDAVTPMTIATGVSEEDSYLDCQIDFFTISVAPLKNYSVTVRIDMRDIYYCDSIRDVVSWWENECGYIPMRVPEEAKLPMNSLWYSYHQNLDVEDIIKECNLSREMGMRTVIIDEGWETDDTKRGFAYCGDWEVAESKIPDMKSFVDRIHETGMKAMIWYSVPFVGENTKNYKRFKDMLLDVAENNKKAWSSLDPRYKEVREFLIETYKNALLNWSVDGLKLDFIDSFVLYGKSLEYDERRDYQSLEEAIDVLMTDITKALTEINSEVLIEFRQTYVGPAIRKYGNMFRVGDCPQDAIINRVNTVNLRLTSGKTAVHSDMLMWNYDEPVECAAVQLASILYSVPQISMKIQQLNNEHKKMLKFYLDFWTENKDTLINGKIYAHNPESCYSIVYATKDDRTIYTAYTDSVIEGNNEKELIAVNASRHESLLFKNLKGRNYKVVNCMGEDLGYGRFDSKLLEVKVPLGGIVFVE